MKITLCPFICLALLVVSCQQEYSIESISKPDFYYGADLSYVNEMEDCGGFYRQDGDSIEPFKLFADKGHNLVRARLWHNPDWTDYSNLADVEKTLSRAKEAGMLTLLDFHYSDTWADPHQQLVPKAWEGLAMNLLGDSVYQYTYNTLSYLYKKGLTPHMVQIGNETNAEILKQQPVQDGDRINWNRNLFLLNKGIEAVLDFNQEHNTSVERMIHIAQPENAFWWFREANENGGLLNYDWIALSYYPKWSDYQVNEISEAITELRSSFGKKVMIVETAYPYNMINGDQAGNILGQDALIAGYQATPQGQLDYMVDLTNEIKAGGGEGLVYWEPAWVVNNCSTRWGLGSHWDNATFFDNQNKNEALPVFDYCELTK